MRRMVDRGAAAAGLPIVFVLMLTALVHAGEARPFPPPRPLQVVVQRGLWSRHFRIEEGLGVLGGAIEREAWTSGGTGFGWLGTGSQGGGWTWWLPAGRELRQRHVLVVCNAHPGFLRKRQQEVVDYVRGGGSVLFLGGRFALGRAHAKSPLAEITPAELPGEGRWRGSDLVHVPEGLPLKPGRDAGVLNLPGFPSDRPPVVLWYHTMKPKAGAKVVLTAGDRPLLVVGESDAGRVAVFAGTVMGDPSEGQLPFWQWEHWPRVMAATLRWLAEAPARAPRGIGRGLREQVTAARQAYEGVIDQRDRKAREEKWHAVTAAASADCHDAESLAFLLGEFRRAPGDLAAPVLETLSYSAWRHVTPKMAADARTLIDSGQPKKTALGLIVLGASGAAGAEKTLGAFHRSGRVREREAEGLGGGGLLDEDAGMGVMQPGQGNVALLRDAESIARMIRLAALAGLGHLGERRALPVLRDGLDLHRKEGPLRPEGYPDMLSDENRLYQQALLSRLRCGDAEAAGPVVAFMMENRYIIMRARTEQNKPKTTLERVHGQIPVNLDWEQRLLFQLWSVPEEAALAAMSEIAGEPDRRIAPIALALCAGRRLTPEMRRVLRGSSVAAVSALGVE